MLVHGAITRALRKTARNASLLGLTILAALLYLLVCSRWFPASAPVVMWWPFEVVGWLAVVVTLALTWDSVRALLQPKHHGAIARLREFGPPSELLDMLASDYEAEAEHERYGSALFVRRFVVIEELLRYAIVPINAIVWAYAKEVQHRKYGITMRITYEVYLCLLSGERLCLGAAPSDYQNQLLCCEQRNTRGMVVGEDEELEAAWDDDPQLVIEGVNALADRGELELGPGAVKRVGLQLRAEQILAEGRALSERAQVKLAELRRQRAQLEAELERRE